VLNIKKDGTELPISLSTARICSSDGSLLGLIGVARNIAERKRLEREGSALSRLNYRLNAATTPLMAATIILEIAWDLFHWDAAYVHLYSASNDKILPVLTVDTINDSRTPVATNTFTHDPSPLMRMVMQQGARVINRGTNDPNICTVPFGDTARPSASMMYVPIHLGEQVIGILSVQSYKTQAFGGTDLKLLQTLADNCGDALARIKAAEALREAESKYRSIFEHATEGIFQTTVAGQYLNVNPALARMFGYASPAEMVASIGNIERETFASPENAAELRHLLAETESVMGFESERFRKDRSRIWTNINVRVSRGSDRQVLYFEGTVQDITKRKEAERILRESERNLRLIAENTEDAIFAFNMDREPLYINSAVEALTGYTFGDIQERGFVNWIHPDDEKRMLTLWEDLYKGAGHSEVEFRLITKNGEMKWCSSTWGPLFDEAGKQIGVQGRERDISERKELEQQLLESTTDERRRVGHELHDGLGQFLAGVSFKAKALEQTLLANKSTHWAEASELVSLVSQAIKQTRTIARGLDPVDIETIGLPAALQNLSAETETMFNTACGFACSDATLPALKPEVALSLYRMAQEAIHNAVVHGNSRRIGITLSMTPSDVLLCVKDDGTGFNAEDMKARGMGLRVMQYRARSVGAILEVSSKPGAGTEIRCGLGRSAAFA
ncbi:MAG TPA: PAS domain S-box protein, partial [Candidatus Dormibacteraeota bacterium]|nr:PAS domain S-box protein [Candidatus Dormibacteraeota bacterium]